MKDTSDVQPTSSRLWETHSPDELKTELDARHHQTDALLHRPKGLEHIDTDLLTEAILHDPRAIYLPDDRVDLYQVKDPNISRLADSIVLAVAKDRLVEQQDGSFQLHTTTLQKGKNLCTGEQFADQPVGGFCTGFFITPSCIITAGHCLTHNIEDVYFITGFRMADAATAVTSFQPNQIFEAVKIIRSADPKAVHGDQADYAIIEVVCIYKSTVRMPLEKQIVGKPLPLSPVSLVNTNDSVFVMGHPSGLPLKFAPNSQVRDNSSISFFIANLDTFGGNSGSPVFDVNNKVIGILVRGDTDYIPSPEGCKKASQYPTTGGRGEDVQRITGVVGHVCDLSIQLDIGNNGLYGDREVYVRLSRSVEKSTLLPITHFNRQTSYTFPLDAENMGIFCIEDIDYLEIMSPSTQSPIFPDSWVLDRAIIRVNGGQALHNFEINHTFLDIPDPGNNTWDKSIIVLDDSSLLCPYADLRLFSGGKWSGCTASIKVNGHELGQWGRGMNVAVLDEKSGKLLQTASYDTNPEGSTVAADAFAKFLEDLPIGRIVAIAVMDDAGQNLNERARKACESIGSAHIRQLSYRSSWTIVGVKGATIGTVAETIGPDEKISSQLRYQLFTQAAREQPGVTIRCHSAGRDVGNTAFFTVNGQKVERKSTRGMNVVIIDPKSGHVTLSQTFDTHEWKTQADEFATFIENIPFGTIVAVAVMDEAQERLNERARHACRSIGSEFIDQLEYHQSWAIVGIKGAVPGCVSEALNTSGATEVLAWIPIPLR